MSGARYSFSVLLTAFTAVVCLSVLAKISVSADYNSSASGGSSVFRAERGRILDRSGAVLAEDSSTGGRRYPSELCPHILGSLSADGKAVSGAELAFDSLLSGHDGVDDDDRLTMPVNGKDVHLTIDSRLQRTAERILDKAAERSLTVTYSDTTSPYSGKAGAIVALDCTNGEVLAMANYPRYSLSTLSRDHSALLEDPALPLLDRAAQGLYRPGSVFKTVTAAAALSEGAVSPETKFWCGSRLWADGSLFTCMQSHGYLDVKQALGKSCNIWFYQAGLRVGGSRLRQYAELFGYGDAPDFELPTAGGSIASKEVLGFWNDAQLVQAAIGQSATTATPLQLCCHAMTLANCGRRCKPTLLPCPDPEPVSVIPDNGCFGIIREGMLLSAENTYGEFSLSGLPEPCAIKTGTPQSERGYDSTVIGFYPADRPKLAFAIVLEEGVNAKHAVRELIEGWLECSE